MGTVLLPYDKPLLRGTLVRRYKRFLADVVLAESGEKVTVHVPNTGSMLSCSTPGSEVVVSDSGNPRRRYRMTLELVRVASGPYGWAGVNTALPNALVAAAVSAGEVPELLGYHDIRREVNVEKGCRLDLVLRDELQPHCFVEIKNVTLVTGQTAFFPDSVTERGRRHLEVLSRLAVSCARAVMFYLIQRPDCVDFKPADHLDPEYGKTLRRVIGEGVEVLAYRTRLSLEGAGLAGAVPFIA